LVAQVLFNLSVLANHAFHLAIAYGKFLGPTAYKVFKDLEEMGVNASKRTVYNVFEDITKRRRGPLPLPLKKRCLKKVGRARKIPDKLRQRIAKGRI